MLLARRTLGPLLNSFRKASHGHGHTSVPAPVKYTGQSSTGFIEDGWSGAVSCFLLFTENILAIFPIIEDIHET